MNITYERNKDGTVQVQHVGKPKMLRPSYWIYVNGTLTGYVISAKAGRSGGTTSSWVAYRTDDGMGLSGLCMTMRTMKEAVRRRLEAG